jgi:hypothetical protein
VVYGNGAGMELKSILQSLNLRLHGKEDGERWASGKGLP